MFSGKVSLIDRTSKPDLKPHASEDFKRVLEKVTYRRASSSLNFASNSLLGGYLGRTDGSHANGFVVKNWCNNLETWYYYMEFMGWIK